MKNILRFFFVVFCLVASSNPLFARSDSGLAACCPFNGNANTAGGDSTMVRRGDPGMLHGAPAKYMMLNRMRGGSQDKPFRKFGSTSPTASPTLSRTSCLSGGGMKRQASADSAFWQQTNGPYGGYIEALAINSSGYIFAGTDGGGVYLSTNNGTSWIEVNNGLTNSDVSLAINSSGYIFAGTDGGGVFRSVNSTVTDVQNEGGQIPISYGLYQNYPNPFNWEMSIRRRSKSREMWDGGCWLN